MEITNIDSFLSYYHNIRERTKRLLAVIPKEQLDWAYMPGKFTIADQIRHIAAIERYMFAETIAGKPSCYRGCGKDLADGYDAVMTWFDLKHEESLAIFHALSNNDLQRKCLTPGNALIPTWKWLRAMVEHEIHHRAQIYLYLNMIGVTTPPIFGLTSEEVAAYSKPE
ncbi:DinB family protein [Chitinophaga vietnamensis]|uniref:DinB family protein n=1 Tax=Chitinophaga vietnamensis TaxID=2593957 RepID=UPI001178AF7F|nr:DinB family protein [Chitinophaga vietnamensis]